MTNPALRAGDALAAVVFSIVASASVSDPTLPLLIVGVFWLAWAAAGKRPLS